MEKQATTRQLKVAREIQKDLAEIIRGKGMAFFARLGSARTSRSPRHM